MDADFYAELAKNGSKKINCVIFGQNFVKNNGKL